MVLWNLGNIVLSYVHQSNLAWVLDWLPHHFSLKQEKRREVPLCIVIVKWHISGITTQWLYLWLICIAQGPGRFPFVTKGAGDYVLGPKVHIVKLLCTQCYWFCLQCICFTHKSYKRSPAVIFQQHQNIGKKYVLATVWAGWCMWYTLSISHNGCYIDQPTKLMLYRT